MAHAVHTRGWVVILPAVLACVLGTALAGTSAAATNYGKLSGLVVDPTGTPQMGANVKVVAEDLATVLPTQLFTNQHGSFIGTRLPAGFYDVQVTLTGFLPTIQRHIHVAANLTTLVKVEMHTVFASLERLRRGPQQPTSSDDWKWVLRASAATRPVLQWTDPRLNASRGDGESGPRHARAELELTSGSREPGSVSNLPEAPATAFAYDQPIGQTGRLLFAGQMSYGHEVPAAGFASTWLPSGDAQTGPATEFVIRQAWLGPDGLMFRGERISHHNTLGIGNRAKLKYGAEVVSAQLGPSTTSLRPSVGLDVLISRSLEANFMVVSGTPTNALSTAMAPGSPMDSLNSFPVLMVRNGKPVLDGGWHEEIGVRYHVAKNSTLEAAAFHDHSSDTPIFGRGGSFSSDYLQDPFSSAFVYDAGATDSAGARIAFRQKIGDSFDIAAVYALASALAQGQEDIASAGMLRDSLLVRYRHSVGVHFSGKTRRTGTQFSVGYKWLSGQALTRQDAYGEALYDLDPYLSLSVRQQLPGTIGSCHWMAMADFRNLLAQGYVPVMSQDGQMVLMSASRSFRGGISFQF